MKPRSYCLKNLHILSYISSSTKILTVFDGDKGNSSHTNKIYDIQFSRRDQPIKIDHWKATFTCETFVLNDPLCPTSFQFKTVTVSIKWLLKAINVAT